MASTVKVDNVQKVSDASNIIKKCGTTITLGASGDSVNLASGATQTGFGASGAVSWVTTPKVTGDSPVTGVSGNGYFMKTTAGSITLNLPAGSAGDIVAVADYAATFATNALSITPNGSEKIGGTNGTVQLGINGQAATFVYVDSTQGWVNTMDSTSDIRATTYIQATGGSVTTCGDYKIHVFTSPGTFTVSSQGSPTNDEAQYLVVAGGGSGAAANYGNIGEGGGGAGGFRVYDGCSPATPPLNAPAGLTVISGSYPITVGGGAAVKAFPGATTAVVGCSGSPSIYATITSTGGGWGALCGGTPPSSAGPGGSGGGGGRGNANWTCGGSGNTPPVSPPQGQNGGNGTPTGCYGPPAPSPKRNGGGGGGAGQAGGSGNDYGARYGGAGSYVCSANFFGPPGGNYGTPGPVGPGRYFAGGGGGAGQQINPDGQAGGVGGGTAGNNGGVATDAAANTGGGGGAASSVSFPANVTGGGRGGSGIVVIKYKYQ